MSSEDPWFWTNESLVAHLCDSEDLFKSAGCGFERLPDPVVLKERIPQTHVTGKLLLSSVDLSTLMNDLGIRNITQKIGFLSVVELLQSRSDAYQQYEAARGVQALQIQDQQSSMAFADATPSDHKRRKLSHHSNLVFSEDTAVTTLAAYNEWLQGGEGGGAFDDLLRWDEEGQDAMSDTYASPDDQMEDSTLDDNDEDDFEELPPDLVDQEDSYMGQNATVRSDLTSEEIADIINERIEFYAQSWVPKKGRQKTSEGQDHALEIWQDAENSGQRMQLVGIYSNLVQDLGGRLNELGDAILQVPGKTSADIRKQCNNLEVTVHDLEEAEWYLSVYKLEPVQEPDDIRDEEIHSRDPSPVPVDTSLISETHDSMNVIDLGSPSGTSSSEDLEYEDIKEETAKEAHHSPLLAAQSPTAEPTIFPSVENQDDVGSNLQSRSSVSTSLNTIGHTGKTRTNFQTHKRPENELLGDIQRWTWAQLVETRDRKRVVSKALSEMDVTDREMIRGRLQQVGKANLIREIPACILMLSKGETRLQGALPRDMHKILTSVRLFLCWWLCNDYLRKLPDTEQLQDLFRCLQDNVQDPSIFYDYLGTIMATTFSPRACKENAGVPVMEIIEISDDEDVVSKPSRVPASRFFQQPTPQEQASIIMLD